MLQRRSPARDDNCHSSGWHAELRQQYDTSAVVSARAHGFYTVPNSYEFFLQVDALRLSPQYSLEQGMPYNRAN